MSDLPEFDVPTIQPEAPAELPPKKPRKPMKRRGRPAKVVAVAPPKKRRRKRRMMAKRVVRQYGRAEAPHSSGKFSLDTYRLIGALMEQDAKVRDLVISIVQGLSK